MDWQPIETAPKDGGFFLVWCAPGHCDSGTYGIGERAFLTEGDIGEWGWSEVRFHPLLFVPPLVVENGKTASAAPTHWTPLPDPPETT